MKIGTIILALLAVLSLYLGYSHFSSKAAQRDSIPPVIQVSQNRIEVNTDATDAELLRYVTASDSKDGDLTDRVLVENIVKNENGAANEFTISYVVFDNDNNMARTTAKLIYKDYHQIHFALHQPLRINNYTGVLAMKKVFSAIDCIDGNVFSNMQITGLEALEADKVEPGFYDITITATNSLGDTTTLPCQVEVFDQSYEESLRPSFMLNDYIVYASEEEPFDYLSNLVYIKDLGNVYQIDTEDMVSVYTYRGRVEVTKAEYDGKFGKWLHVSKIEFNSDVDYSKPGIYPATYNYVSQDSSYEAHATIYIVVE